MDKMLSCACGEKYREEAYAAVRIVTGLMFFMHGYGKFNMGIETVTGFFEGAGVPLANIVAYVVTYGEIIGGVMLILGLYTHWVSKLNIIIILGAIYFVHLTNGYGSANGGYEYPLLILAVTALILTHGAGRYSLDAKRAQSQNQQV